MQNIYTELDSIFDTRLPILTAISYPIAEEVVSSGLYHNRIKDEFGPISADLFNAIYAKRKKMVLRYAGLTKIIYVVGKIYRDRITDIKNCEIRNSIKIFINTYPYDLSGSEQDELTKALCLEIGLVDIVFLKASNKQLTPAWIKDKGINSVIKYDLLPWIEYHMGKGNFEENSLANISLACPPLLDIYASPKQVNLDIYKAIKESLQLYANLEFIDTDYFCKVLHMPKASGEEKK